MIKFPRISAGGVKVATAIVSRRQTVQLLAVLALVSVGVMLITISSPHAAGNFDPTITFETSTTRATAHPDLRITIDNTVSDEDIKDLTIDMPNSFWGSLNAVPFKCAYAVAQAGNCDPQTAVGTIDAEAKIDNSDAKISGSIYLTEAAPGNDDPAGLSIEVPTVVGGVDLGSVIVNSRVMARYDNTVDLPTGATGPIKGIRTVINNIPDSHTDNSANASGRTVTFKMTRMVANLRSNQTAPRSPLLTNPSKCGTTQFSWTAIGDDIGTKSDSSAYVVDQCNTAKLGLSQFSFSPSTTAAGAGLILTTDIGFDPDGSGVSTAQVTLPPYASANTAAFGDASVDQCPTESFRSFPLLGYAVFDPAVAGFECPAQAKIGTANAFSPMLPDPLKGDVYLIEKAPIPNIGVYFGPSVDPGNPAGVVVSLVGTTATVQTNPNCDPLFETCAQSIRATFAGIPDAPVSAISIVLGTNAVRLDSLGNPLQGTPLTMAAPADNVCVGSGDITGQFVSHSGPSVRAYGVDELPVAGCGGTPPVVTSGPAGATTTDSQPSFAFTSSGSPNCAFDFGALEPCSSSISPSSPLANGLHHLEVDDGTKRLTRGFVVEPADSTDSPPQTTIDTGPADASTTSDTTPAWTFSADEASKFQCSMDDGAFVPCGPGTAGTAGDFTVAAADALLPGTNHKFQVRAQDNAGNVDASPATVNFTVSVPFDPTFTVDLDPTTPAVDVSSAARAHPDIDVTITNPSEQDIENATIKMPDGFLGGLQGVAVVCQVADADAGNCPAGSQVGTIDTEAIVDQSIVRISGQVYLTEGRQAGDPAGLSIKVPAQIQSINMGDIIVPARLKIRGEVEGIDSMVVGVPREIDPPNSINPWDGITQFTMRKMVIKLRTNAGASQELLTNPSSCDATQFQADFETYTSSTDSVTQPFNVTGCDTLGFAPQLAVEVKRPDGTLPNGDDFQKINLSATLNASAEEAGISGASILMPKPLTVDAGKLPPVICEVNQYPNDCPAVAQVGTAEATSPLLLPGEFLSGPVYLLRNPGKLPKLFVKLGGRISVNVVGTTSFENDTQIRTRFTDLPDAPLSTFTMNVNDFMLTMAAPCDLAEQFGTAMTGTLTGHNGKSAPVSSTLGFNCNEALRDGLGIKKVFRKRGANTTLSLGLRAKGKQPNMKKVTLRLGKHLTLNRSQLMRRLSIRVNGKRMSRAGIRRSVKVIDGSTIQFQSGNKRYRRIDFAFRRGSLTAGRKLRRPTVRLTVTPGMEKSRDSKLVNLSGASIKRYSVGK